jgi:Ni,Fe-hydrogenase maturation factor
MKTKIFYFGNPHLDEDNSAIKICEKLKTELKDIEFKQIDNTFQLFDENFNNTILIDVVSNLNEVKKINIKDLSQGNINTAHDFDLSFFLKLNRKDIEIIGIPNNYPEDKALKEVENILRTG